MTRIDFYLLTSASPDLRLDYACRLAHKAWSKGHRVYLNCADEGQAETLDSLLWGFRADAFIPHSLAKEDAGEAVVCGSGEPPAEHHDLLINLADSTADSFSRFTRMAEIVIEHDPVRLPARERFRFYRERGYPLQTHQIRTAG
ncbi:DNA polymerase III subunit chi [Halopseudomonas sp.]|uniref:DNA polymerase III subunit chi n=1 Tax=Halopseudomonas sp. TaxID=2901191 RepID=UPI003566EAE5